MLAQTWCKETVRSEWWQMWAHPPTVVPPEQGKGLCTCASKCCHKSWPPTQGTAGVTLWDCLFIVFITFQTSLPHPEGTVHGPSRQLEGSKTAGVFHIFQRDVFSRSVRRTREWEAAMALSGSKITPALSVPLTLPALCLLEEPGRGST